MIKKSSGREIKNKIMPNEELGEELHKPSIRKFETRKVHLSFIDNNWGADFVDMQWRSKFKFVFCVIDGSSKHAWVIPF